MKEKMIGFGYAILDNMVDRGSDVVIFTNFLNAFRIGDYETCERMNVGSLSYLDIQPLRDEIIDYYSLVKEFVKEVRR